MIRVVTDEYKWKGNEAEIPLYQQEEFNSTHHLWKNTSLSTK